MKSTSNDLFHVFIEKGIRPSHQRIKILEYLANNPCHPTADMVLSAMEKELPTLSKSTVYKTLNAFVEAQMLREITIEDNEIRYEYNLTDHGHFKCIKCGFIYDFNVDFDIFQANELSGFQVYDKNIYYKGVCKSCLDHN